MKRSAVLLTTIILIVTFIVGILGGCGSKEAVDNKEGRGQTDQKDNSENDSESQLTPESKQGPPKLRVYVGPNVEEFPSGMNENNNPFIKFIEEKTGYDLEWMIMPRDNAQEKLNIMMASGETPDLIQSSKLEFATFAQQQVLAPLGAYIDQVGANIKKLVPENTWKAVTFNGEILAIPMPQNMDSTTGLIVRKDWLRNIGIDEPKSLDDVYKVLKSFKDQKLGGDGTIPLVGGAGDGNGNAFGYLEAFAGAFGMAVPYLERDGSIIYTYTQPEAKDFLVFMNKLYNEGLLDQEYPVNKRENVIEKMSSGKGGMTCLYWWDARSVDTAIKEKVAGAELGYIAPPIGPKGSWGVHKNAPVKYYLFVPIHNVENARAAVDFINKFTNPEVLKYVTYGEEGKYFEEKDGVLYPKDNADEIAYQVYYNLWDTKENFLNRVMYKGFGPYYKAITEHDTYDNIYNFAPPIDVVEEKGQELSDLVNEYFIKIISGAMSIDKYHEYVEKWKAAGGEASVKAIQDWYDSVK